MTFLDDPFLEGFDMLPYLNDSSARELYNNNYDKSNNSISKDND